MTMLSEFRVITYVQSGNAFYELARLTAFVAGLSRLGVYVAGEDSAEVRAQLRATGPDTSAAIAAGVSPLLQSEMASFCKKHSEELLLVLFSPALAGDLQGFEALIVFQPHEHTMVMSLHAQPYTAAPFLSWLDILLFTYNTWHPLYSYMGDFLVPTTYVDALNDNIHFLYPLNLFRHDLVEECGRARVLQTPAWRVTELEDGSVLVIPQFPAYRDTDDVYDFSMEDVAQHLELLLPW